MGNLTLKTLLEEAKNRGVVSFEHDRPYVGPNQFSNFLKLIDDMTGTELAKEPTKKPVEIHVYKVSIMFNRGLGPEIRDYSIEAFSGEVAQSTAVRLFLSKFELQEDAINEIKCWLDNDGSSL